MYGSIRGVSLRTVAGSKLVFPISCMRLHSSADIVVSGGGMVGTACAASLAKLDMTRGKKIMLLESSKKREILVGEEYSNRVSALAPSSMDLLDRLGAGQIIRDNRLNNIQAMKIWESCSAASIIFRGEEAGRPLSYLVENDITQKALNSVMETFDNLTVLYGAKVADYIIPGSTDQQNLPEDGVLIRLENGDTIETQLLIGADGNRSLVRSSLGCEDLSWDYDSMGVVATLELEDEVDNHTAFQRFLPTGPLALLPLSSKFTSLVWSLPTKQAKAKVGLPEDEFIQSLEKSLWSTSDHNHLVNSAAQGLDLLLQAFSSQNQNFTELPPKIKGVRNRACFPLGFLHSNRYVGPRTVLVGDAAHRVHPLAGQGVNLGFGDVDALTRIVDGCIRDGAGLGNRSYLLDYETARQRHNVPTMLTIDSLQKLYSTTFTPLVLARSLGLQLTNSLDPLKRMMVSHAS